jgi:hypothetical protein
MQLYEMRITAMGEVRDAEGNLISSEPVEATLTLTADQVRDILEGDGNG